MLFDFSNQPSPIADLEHPSALSLSILLMMFQIAGRRRLIAEVEQQRCHSLLF
jgi:hypothetical protein